ncbi:helix-turn-helix domain-containing protein [Sphingomonas sp. TF3]|uniref:helix-turn-helix domain-containing protein n=3 Tax=Pseudomonadota TaxID=1224 RepID=UPI0011D176EE|nr:helix-turn-helix transcriptional regulator [Sphingomonas sp. TF3]
MRQQINLQIVATGKVVAKGVLDASRLRARMAERKLSQSELARRVGISQASIYNLVSGKGYGSKHIHLIARELGTTPAYLTGETDQPEDDTPDAPRLDSEIRELFDHLLAMDTADRRAIAQIARGLTRHAPSGRDVFTVHAPVTSYRGPPVSENALGQMIEGLLRAVDLTAPVPELARELAELWPTAIAQVQGPLYALDDETPAAPAESPATLASAGRAPR